jgi:hypothetical protein
MLPRLDQSKNTSEAVDPAQAAMALVVQGITTDSGSQLAPCKIAKVARIHRLVEDKAWTEAALALIEIELPQWKLRRLTCDDGEWFCSLMRHPDLPVELDDAGGPSPQSADGDHAGRARGVGQKLGRARQTHAKSSRGTSGEAASRLLRQFRLSGCSVRLLLLRPSYPAADFSS